MDIKKEVMQDVDLKIPKILIHGTRGMIDNVKAIELLTEKSIVVSCGKQSVSVCGDALSVTWLEGERLIFEGTIDSVEFYGKKAVHG